MRGETTGAVRKEKGESTPRVSLCGHPVKKLDRHLYALPRDLNSDLCKVSQKHSPEGQHWVYQTCKAFRALLEFCIPLFPHD